MAASLRDQPNLDPRQVREPAGVRRDHGTTRGEGRRGDDQVVAPSRATLSAGRDEEFGHRDRGDRGIVILPDGVA